MASKHKYSRHYCMLSKQKWGAWQWQREINVKKNIFCRYIDFKEIIAIVSGKNEYANNYYCNGDALFCRKMKFRRQASGAQLSGHGHHIDVLQGSLHVSMTTASLRRAVGLWLAMGWNVSELGFEGESGDSGSWVNLMNFPRFGDSHNSWYTIQTDGSSLNHRCKNYIFILHIHWCIPENIKHAMKMCALPFLHRLEQCRPYIGFMVTWILVPACAMDLELDRLHMYAIYRTT